MNFRSIIVVFSLFSLLFLGSQAIAEAQSCTLSFPVKSSTIVQIGENLNVNITCFDGLNGTGNIVECPTDIKWSPIHYQNAYGSGTDPNTPAQIISWNNSGAIVQGVNAGSNAIKAENSDFLVNQEIFKPMPPNAPLGYCEGDDFSLDFTGRQFSSANIYNFAFDDGGKVFINNQRILSEPACLDAGITGIDIGRCVPSSDQFGFPNPFGDQLYWECSTHCPRCFTQRLNCQLPYPVPQFNLNGNNIVRIEVCNGSSSGALTASWGHVLFKITRTHEFECSANVNVISTKDNDSNCGEFLDLLPKEAGTGNLIAEAGKEYLVFLDMHNTGLNDWGTLACNTCPSHPYQLGLIGTTENDWFKGFSSADKYINEVCPESTANLNNCINNFPNAPITQIEPVKSINGSPKWYRFFFKIKAPSTTGIYYPSFQMVNVGTEWFGEICTKPVNVIPQVIEDSNCLPETSISNGFPEIMEEGLSVSTFADFQNTGNTVWNKSDMSLNVSGSANLSLLVFNKVNQVNQGSLVIMPGEFIRFYFTLTAPTENTGDKNIQWQLLKNGSPFGQQCSKPTKIITGPTCSVELMPSEITAGPSASSTTSVTIKLQNFSTQPNSATIDCSNGTALLSTNCLNTAECISKTCSPYINSGNPQISAAVRQGIRTINCEPKNLTVKPTPIGGLVEIQSINLVQINQTLTEPVPYVNKNNTFIVEVKVKNSSSLIPVPEGKVRLSMPGTNVSFISQITDTKQLASGTITTFTFGTMQSQLQSLEDSKTYTIIAELTDTAAIPKFHDKQEKSFVVQRAGVNVPEGNPMLAFAIVGIVLGIIYVSGRKKQ